MPRSLRTACCVIATAVTALAIASAAQAQTFAPVSTAVTATATNFLVAYGFTTFTCPTATSTGTTASKASDLLSLNLSLSKGCQLDILGFPATAACTGTYTLHAGASTSSTVSLDSGFSCTFNGNGYCSITVVGPQTATGSTTLNEATTLMTLTFTVAATRSGSPNCGPATFTAAFTATFSVTPASLAIT